MTSSNDILPQISIPEGSALAAEAAGTLRGHLGRLTIACGLSRIEIAHGPAADGEGFDWTVTDGVARIEADGPRGSFYGACDLLEQMGFAWPAPGDGAVVAPEEANELPGHRGRQSPALPGRSLILGHHAFMARAEEWIVWAARNRLNTIFFHIDEHGLGLGAIPSAQWRAAREAAIACARRYGMTLELGGHGLATLLPRRAFDDHPDWFPVRNGTRDRRFNLNALSAEALAVVKENAGAWFRANQGFDVYHLWADDLADGGWCEQAAADGYSASDQLMLATNAVAEVLAEIAPEARLAFLSYHDTEEPPRVAPRDNVVLTFAPRLRCYAAGIDAPHVVNGKYPDLWRRNVTAFPAGGARVFEYWLDAILFKIVAPPMVDVIRRDLAFYAANGAHTVGALATGSLPFIAPNLNAFAFARLSWDPRIEAKTIRQSFCGHVFESALHLPQYFESLERAFALDLDLSPEEAFLKGRGTLEETIADPPADIGSPFNVPADLVGEAQVRQEKALKALDDAEQVFAAMYRSRPDEDPSHAMLAEECHRFLCNARLNLRMSALDVRGSQAAGTARDVLDAVKHARFHLMNLEREMRGFVREPYVSNTKLLLWLFLGLALDKAEDDLIEGDGARRKRLRNRMETARQNFARMGSLWSA
jgi:hypothetical protein